MIDVSVPGRVSRKKVKAHTRKQLHALHDTMRREARLVAKAAFKMEQSRARRDSRKFGVFYGCSPERTEALADAYERS